jgi:hypothetical protein
MAFEKHGIAMRDPPAPILLAGAPQITAASDNQLEPQALLPKRRTA